MDVMINLFNKSQLNFVKLLKSDADTTVHSKIENCYTW